MIIIWLIYTAIQKFEIRVAENQSFEVQINIKHLRCAFKTLHCMLIIHTPVYFKSLLQKCVLTVFSVSGGRL